MENSFNDSAEAITEVTLEENQQFEFNQQVIHSSGPGNEEEDEEEDEGEAEEGNENKGANDENPPLDPDIVHSPVQPKSGGLPT